MSRPIRIVCIDPFKEVRDSLKLLFEDSRDIRFVGEANSAIEMLSLCEQTKPDVVIFDFASKADDIGIIIHLLRAYPAMKVLVLTANMDADCVRNAIRAGVGGYLYKGLGMSELAEAIHAVYQGKRRFDQDMGILAM